MDSNIENVNVDDLTVAVNELEKLGIIGSDARAILAVYRLAKAFGLVDLANKLIAKVVEQVGTKILEHKSAKA